MTGSKGANFGVRYAVWLLVVGMIGFGALSTPAGAVPRPSKAKRPFFDISRRADATTLPRTRWFSDVDTSFGTASGNILMVKGGETKAFGLHGICYSPIPMASDPDFERWLSDVFWDTVPYDGFSPAKSHITHNYDFLWASRSSSGVTARADLDTMRNLNASAIRVYGLVSRFQAWDTVTNSPYIPDTTQWNNPKVVARVTHKQFLDECWAQGKKGYPVYVLVGLFLDQTIYFKKDHDNPDPAVQREIQWYTEMACEVVREIGNHPAVMGFIINNEVDDPSIAGDTGPEGQFFWDQIRSVSQAVKYLAPDKLVGVAFHSSTVLPKLASQQMRNTPDLDFWGINIYETNNLDDYFYINNAQNLGWALLPPGALKPVIATEYGLPLTYHKIGGQSCASQLSISDGSAAVGDSVANIVWRLGGALLNTQYPICAGMTYFEFSDEWYKQADVNNCLAPGVRDCTWMGEITPVPNFPGGYWDDEGFGLFAIKRGGTLSNCDPSFVYEPSWDYFGPNPVFDQLLSGRDYPTTRRTLEEVIQILYAANGGIDGVIRSTAPRLGVRR